MVYCTTRNHAHDNINVMCAFQELNPPLKPLGVLFFKPPPSRGFGHYAGRWCLGVSEGQGPPLATTVVWGTPPLCTTVMSRDVGVGTHPWNCLRGIILYPRWYRRFGHHAASNVCKRFTNKQRTHKRCALGPVACDQALSLASLRVKSSSGGT